jgi:hypothetical protein
MSREPNTVDQFAKWQQSSSNGNRGNRGKKGNLNNRGNSGIVMVTWKSEET